MGANSRISIEQNFLLKYISHCIIIFANRCEPWNSCKVCIISINGMIAKFVHFGTIFLALAIPFFVYGIRVSDRSGWMRWAPRVLQALFEAQVLWFPFSELSKGSVSFPLDNFSLAPDCFGAFFKMENSSPVCEGKNAFPDMLGSKSITGTERKWCSQLKTYSPAAQPLRLTPYSRFQSFRLHLWRLIRSSAS